MGNKSTWIKIDRNILNWGWYKDTKTKSLFLHLLIKANVKPGKFMGVKIDRGEVATSYSSLAEETGLTVKNVRTALEHLKSTEEVAVKRHSKFSVISILNYSLYQDIPAEYRAINGQSSGNQVAVNGQQSKNKRIKEYKNNNTRAREETGSGKESDSDRSWEDECGVPDSLRGDFPNKEAWLEFYERQR